MAFDGTNYVIAWNYVPVTSKTKEGTVRIARVTKDGVSLDGSASDVGGRAVSKTSTLGANPRIGRVGSQTMVVWEIETPGSAQGPRRVGLAAAGVSGADPSVYGLYRDSTVAAR